MVVKYRDCGLELVCIAFYRVFDDRFILFIDYCICYVFWRYRLIKVYNVIWFFNIWFFC